METNITKGGIVGGAKGVTLAVAKTNSNITDDTQDTYLQLLLDAAIDEAERYTDRAILNRDFSVAFKDWAELFTMPIGPVTAITSVSYKDENGDSQVLDASDYELVNDEYEMLQELYFNLEDYPDLEEGNRFPITVTGEIGYKDTDVPPAIKGAILLKFSQKELFREDAPVRGADRSFKAALRNYRKW